MPWVELVHEGPITLETETSSSSVIPINPKKRVNACPWSGFVKPSAPSSKPEQCDTVHGSSGSCTTSRNLADRSLRCLVLQAPVSEVSWLMPDLLSPCMCFFTPPYPRTSRRAPVDSPFWYASLYAKSSASAVLWVMKGCLVEAHMIGFPPWVIMMPCTERYPS